MIVAAIALALQATGAPPELNAWAACLADASDRTTKSSAPAEAIADAAFQSCLDRESAVEMPMRRSVGASMTPRVLRQTREILRDGVLARIMNSRRRS
jgi:hypothetical protein